MDDAEEPGNNVVVSPTTSDYNSGRPSTRRRSHKAEAIDRVASGLAALREDTTTAVVIEAPETPIHVQFYRTDDGFVAEAVGESNLPKLIVYRTGPLIRAKLPDLGWAAPADPEFDHGNWTRTWPSSAWDPAEVAPLVARTFREAYGLLPWALAVRLISSRSTTRRPVTE